MSWWRAENNATDFIGPNNGTLQNGATFASGKVGQAFSFDGVDDFVNFANAANLNSTTATWDFWVKTTQSGPAGTGYGLIAKHDQSGSFNGATVFMFADNGNVGVQIKAGSNTGLLNIRSTTAINDGQFHHVAIAFQSGSVGNLYIDGRLEATASMPAFSFNATPLRLGKTLDPFWQPFRGQIDEVDVFNRVLTPTGFWLIYNAGSGGKCSNAAPLAAADSYSVSEDPGAPGLTVPAPGVLVNDSDADLNPLTAVLVTGPVSGSLTLNANGSFSYVPAANFNGTDSFTYKASDGTDLSGPATVTITVTAVNDIPVAINDTGTVPEDGTVTIPVLANDSPGPANESSQTLTVTAASALHGTVVINGDGTLNYAPTANYNGPDTITYAIQDNGTTDGAADPLDATGNVAVTVTEVNDSPTAGADTATLPEDGAVTVDVLANDSTGPANESGQTLTITSATALHGAVTINVDGTLSYAPAADYNGPDTIAYTIQDNGTTNGAADPKTATGTVDVTVTPVNDPPTADAQSGTTDDHTSLPITLSGSDIDSTSLAFVIVDGPAHGTLSAVGANSCTTIPNRTGTPGSTCTAVVTTQGTPGKITGGGSVDSGVRNFGFVVMTKTQNGVMSFTGNLEFQDKSKGYNLHSTAITLIRVEPDGKHGSFEGTATVNGVSGYSFKVLVEDNAEPGAGVDKFRIQISGPGGFSYDSNQFATKGGLLDKGGNIQVHKTASSLAIGPSDSSDAPSGGDDLPVLINSAGQLLTGVLVVSVEDQSAGLTAEQRARISDAMNTFNDTLGALGVTLTESDADGSTPADIRLVVASTSECGSAANGVLGCTTTAGEITILDGWNWYAGADIGLVGATQYDLQTIVAHELGHSLGLGHSSDANSVMYAQLAPGMARRGLTANDLSLIEPLEDTAETLEAIPVSGKPTRAARVTMSYPIVDRLGRSDYETAARSYLIGDGERSSNVFSLDTNGWRGSLQPRDEILVGGDGDDIEIGDSARDRLVGGVAASSPVSISDGDGLQNWSAVNDIDEAALDEILAAWSEKMI